jgi:WD40 repeat protein
MAPGVTIAATPPTVDFLYYPEQTYQGNPWSAWGDGTAVADKYYSAIGDHRAPAGNAFVFEYDATRKGFRTLVNLKQFLNMPDGHYSPSKIHSRIDMGSDGWLYFATHRGSTRVTTDQYHFTGDWILRTNPVTGQTQVVVNGPVPKHSLPTGLLDPDRLIFYGGTVAGDSADETVMFFAYDVRARKVLHTAPGGPYRYLIFAKSTGRVYYVNKDDGPLMRYDPKTGTPPVQIPGHIGIRAATGETPDGFVYTVSDSKDARIWRFNTRTEQIDEIGHAAVATQDYVTSLDIDPAGRYLYYVPGAHGSSHKDGSPVVQFDVKTRTKKIIAFLHPYYRERHGFVPLGTYSSALSPEGDALYITWNGNRSGAARGRFAWDAVALTVIHIPKSERQP